MISARDVGFSAGTGARAPRDSCACAAGFFAGACGGAGTVAAYGGCGAVADAAAGGCCGAA
eukprot:5188190-Pleurochrysis_carterae.AAC.1